MLHPVLQPVLQPVLRSPFDRRPTALTISQLLPSGAGRVAAIYSDPARPSYDECIQKNMDAIAAGRPQDCVLFADAAGQTPVVYPIGAGQGKGLLLDRSAGLVRGVEIVSDPELTTNNSAAEWTLAGTDGSNTIAFAGGAVTFTTVGANISISKSGALVVGKTYEVVLDVISQTGVVPGIYTGAEDLAFAAGVGTRRLVFTAAATTMRIKRIGGSGSFTIDSISVRELPGHHQQQPTAAARGEFSRRYNLLTGTDGGSFYYFSGLASYAATALSPRGDMTARRIIENTSTGRHQFYTLNTTVVVGATYKFSIRARRAVGSRDLALQVANIGGVGYSSVTVNLGTGALVAANPVFSNVSIVAIGGGYWEISFTGVTTSSVTAYTYFMNNGAGIEYAGDGESAIDIWGADLRLTADAIPSIPAYQRVTTASDYDEVGFPTYWRAQTDDWAKSHMNPNGATKAYVFWAGQIMSEAATGILAETSVDSSSVNGTMRMTGPRGGGTNQRSFFSRGTLSADAVYVAGAPIGPSRSVFVGNSSIPDGVCLLHINGISVGSSVANQGSGTYTEQDVFFASRAGTSQFANIREYAPPTILFLQPADSLSASHLAKLQKGYAKAVGVAL